MLEYQQGDVMKAVDYNKILEKIKKYKEKSLFIERTEFDEKIQKLLVTDLHVSKEYKNIKIKNFKITEFSNFYLYEYETENYLKKENIKTFVIVIDGNPVIKLEHSENRLNGLKYSNDIYYLYEENTKYLINKTAINSITIGDAKTVTVDLLTRKDSMIREYLQRQIRFYENKDEVLSFCIDDEMLLYNEMCFENRLNIITSEINKNLLAFEDKFNSLLGLEYVKEYKIHRKQGQ